MIRQSRRAPLHEQALEAVKVISFQIEKFAAKINLALETSNLSDDAIDTKEQAIKNINDVADKIDLAICEAAYYFNKGNINDRLDKLFEQFEVKIVHHAFRAGFIYQKPDIPKVIPIEQQAAGKTKNNWAAVRSKVLSKTTNQKNGKTAKDNDKFMVCFSQF